MTTAAQIAAKLTEAFTEIDAEVLAAALVWIEERAAAVKAYKASEEYRNDCRVGFSHRAYERAFNMAGGKTWYHVITGHGPEGRAEFVRKNHAATIAKRNAMIARKLEAAGVVELTGSEFAQTRDGFNGFYKVETNVGPKVVTIRTIRAGGYNIQCLHLRVLVKVR